MCKRMGFMEPNPDTNIVFFRVREVSDIKGIGVRAKVVGRLPNITDVGGDRGRRGRLLRDQPLTRLTKGGRSSKSREERMRSIIKKLLSN